MNRIACGAALAASTLLVCAPGRADTLPLNKAAAAFGSLPDVESMALSPDGKKAVMIGTMGGHVRIVSMFDLADGKLKPITYSNDGMKLTRCGWASNDRLICTYRGLTELYGRRVGFTRLVSMDLDGKNMRDLSATTTGESLRASQFTGGIVDWLDGSSASVLMIRDHVPAMTTGARTASTADGYGVDRVDTRTLRTVMVEPASRNAGRFITDGQGNVRIMALDETRHDGNLAGITDYRYRLAGDKMWRPFSHVIDQKPGDALRPLAVDGTNDTAYALRNVNGRDALYKVKLDQNLAAELVYADPDVDVDDVITIGRRGRTIGASYVTDRRVAVYFDPTYKALAASLAKALPTLPLINFVSASADESTLLLRASSDTDSGHFYVLDRTTKHMSEVLPVRAPLADVKTAAVTSIAYPAGDGTMVPAYLTLPAGSTGKGLPAIVMPHGGPASRDEWGFDWLAQFFASRGFAVIQPEFRGSAGYGDAWYVDNGFKSWKIAIRDVTAAGEYLIKRGIADPAKLAIVGWSYGGYAALQSNVLDPDLFKAVVAIAPVTDLHMLKLEAAGFTAEDLVQRFIGDGPHITEGSPDLHADRFKAPVLMFHGDQDINVGVAESTAMDAALKHAGKQTTLVRYPGLDHQLDDSAARIDMLTKADTFLHAALKM